MHNSKIVKSTYKNARISPRKVQIVANQLRGSKLAVATVQLAHSNKKAARILGKVINDAVANAVNNLSIDKKHLSIKDIKLGPGFTLKRGRIEAKGRSKPILKRSTNITVELVEIVEKTKNEQKS